jgi:polyhydroxyalkanoate synthase
MSKKSAQKKTTEQAKQNKTETLADKHYVDPVALGNVLMDVSRKAQPLLKQFFENYEFEIKDTNLDPLNVREAYMDFLQHLWSDPQRLFELQMKLWSDWLDLWQDTAKSFVGGNISEALYNPAPDDKRFKAPEWQESAIFNYIKQSYLLTSKWIGDVIEQTEGLDEQTRRKVEFYTRQFVDAMAPTNFLLTNPDVLRETLESGGENLVKGLENLLEDLERGKGSLKITTTDYSAFEVGKNLAITAGSVIYQNDLMQLIQYEPSTPKAFKRPLLIVPPWINKYYILDLKPENSFVKWAVDQGHTVFIISWVNPNKKLARKRFEDYMDEGVFHAMKQIKKVTGEKDLNIVGYCLGGTLTAATLAWLTAKGEADQIASATFLTSLVDFEHAGDLKLFIDDKQLEFMDKEMEEKGFLEADSLRTTFSMLRSNDLIWSFVINNYLMGKEPFPFDLLYWNDDSTNMPAAMHSFYLRKCYRENALSEPEGVVMEGVPINMRDVKTPSYFLSTREDHIAPWKATYVTTQLFSGSVTFTLAASGHIAGVVNPPFKNKYCYWTNSKTPKKPDSWFENAKEHEGSWWPHWGKWLEKHAGAKVAARKVGGGKLKPIEKAPGKYVKMKAKD